MQLAMPRKIGKLIVGCIAISRCGKDRLGMCQLSKSCHITMAGGGPTPLARQPCFRSCKVLDFTSSFLQFLLLGRQV